MENWVVMYSQTGSEIMNISKELGFLPALLVTNDYNKTSPIVKEWIDKNNLLVLELPKKAKVMRDYESLNFLLNVIGKPIITLHGYLRILPKEFCELHDNRIFNGHPALIDKFKELKGFNQQEVIFYHKDKYPIIGSVVHKVVPEVDSGEILFTCERINDTVSIEDAYMKLKETSLQSWLKFFQKYK